MNLLLLAAALSAGYLGFVSGFEALSRRFAWSRELTRRAVHVISGLSTLLDYWLLPSAWFLVLIGTSLVGIVLSQRFGWLSSVHSVKRPTYGEIFLPLGTLSTYAVSLGRPDVFVPSLLLMTLADVAGGLVSDYFKQDRKMIRGSLVFFVVAAAILLGAGISAPLLGIAIAGIVTVVERYSPLGSDNTTVPVATAVLLLLLQG